VQTSSLNMSSLRFKSSSSSRGYFSLSTSVVSTLIDNVTLFVPFTWEDTNLLKARTEMFFSPNNSFLELLEWSIVDMAGNPNNATFGLFPTSFVADSDVPRVVSFSLDLDQSVLFLSFSETVNMSKFNISFLSFARALFGGTDVILRNEVSKSVVSLTQVSFVMQQSDVNLLKGSLKLLSPQESILRVRLGAFYDMAGNPCLNSSIAAVQYYRDRTPPTVLSCSLNLSSEVLTLDFDEPVNGDISTVFASKIFIGDVQLSRVWALSTFSTSLNLRLDTSDLNLVKLQRSSSGLSYLSILPSLMVQSKMLLSFPTFCHILE